MLRFRFDADLTKVEATLRGHCALAAAVSVALFIVSPSCRAGAAGNGTWLSPSQAVDAALARDALVRDAKRNLENARMALIQASALTPAMSVSSSTSAASSAGLDPESAITGTDFSSQSYGTSIGVPLRGGLTLDLFSSASTSTTNSRLAAGGGQSFTFASASAGLGVSRPLPIFRDDRVLTEGPRWSAEIGLRSAELAFEDAQRGVVANTLSYFFAAVRAQRQARIAQDSQRQAEELSRIAEEKLKAGKIAEIEAMEARVAADSARGAARSLYAAADTALDTLKNFLGMPLDRPVQPNYEPPTVSNERLNEGELVQHALTHRADLKQLALGIRSAKLSVKQDEAQARPGVFLSGGYSRSGQAPTINGSFDQLINPSWSVGLVATAQLSQKANRAGIEQARSSLHLAETNEALLKDDVRVQIRSLMRQVDTGASNVTLLAETVKTAEENLRVRQVQFDHGLIRGLAQLPQQTPRNIFFGRFSGCQ